jgi:hypothetical protein
MERPLYPCPCCRELTVADPGGFEICRVCDWQDDGQSDQDADVVRGGPNGGLSLTEARERFRASRTIYRKLARAKKTPRKQMQP